jgi:hypothetical protein
MKHFFFFFFFFFFLVLLGLTGHFSSIGKYHGEDFQTTEIDIFFLWGIFELKELLLEGML